MPPTLLDDDLDFGNDFKDSVLMGLDSLVDADLNGIDDVVAPVQAFSTVCIGSLETVLHENRPTRGLTISKQMSSLRKTDFSNTISPKKFTGIAPNSIHNAQYILIDEVYTNLEKSNAKKQ